MSKLLPITLKTYEVQAILDGRKSMKRMEVPEPFQTWMNDASHEWMKEVKTQYRYGQPGDILYVKETFYAYGRWRFITNQTGKKKWTFHDLTTQFGKEYRFFNNAPEKLCKRSDTNIGWYKISSIHMPKEAARIFLEVTDIRAERLQDISEEDATREGTPGYEAVLPRHQFWQLWLSINGPESWNANKWVFAVSFKQTFSPHIAQTTIISQD